jgi:hypothetical protein
VANRLPNPATTTTLVSLFIAILTSSMLAPASICRGGAALDNNWFAVTIGLIAPALLVITLIAAVYVAHLESHTRQDALRLARLNTDLQHGKNLLTLATQAAGIACWEYEVRRIDPRLTTPPARIANWQPIADGCGLGAFAGPGVLRIPGRVLSTGGSEDHSRVQRGSSEGGQEVRDGEAVRGDDCPRAHRRGRLKKMGRETSARRDQAHPLGWKEIKEFIGGAGEVLRADRYLDFHPNRTGKALIRRGKSDAEGQGRVAHLSRETVKWLRVWLEHGKIAEGTVFRAIRPESVRLEI